MCQNSNNWKIAIDDLNSKLFRLSPSVIRGQKQNLIGKEIKNIFGRFFCKKCGRKWNSVNCWVTFKWDYNPEKKNCLVEILKEFGQKCKICNDDDEFIQPNFDKNVTKQVLQEIFQLLKNGTEIRPNSNHCVGISHDSNLCEVCSTRNSMDDNTIMKTSNPSETLNNFPDFCESSLDDQDKINNKSSFKRELQYIDVSNILSTKRPRTEMKYSSQFLR